MTQEKWTVRPLVPGDVIRVYNGRFYHMGIYIGDEKVIHFAGPDTRHLTDSSQARVRISAIDDFAMKGQLEVRDYSLKERLRKRPGSRVISEAKKHLGEGGYDIIHNNCEHFVNKCVFGVAYSLQIDQMRAVAEQGG